MSNLPQIPSGRPEPIDVDQSGALLTEKIGKKNYRDVYIDLNSAAVAGSKLWVEDLNADGLVARPQGNSLAADNCEIDGKKLVFNGQWKKAKMTETQYSDAFTKADQAYSRALQILLDQLKSST